MPTPLVALLILEARDRYRSALETASDPDSPEASRESARVTAILALASLSLARFASLAARASKVVV